MDTQALDAAVAWYFALAIGYNVVSLALREMTRRPLAPTEPIQGILIMALLYVIYASESALDSVAWTALIAVLLVVIAWFGVYRHVIAYRPDRYATRMSWAAAIGINVYGVGVLSLVFVT